MLLISVILFGVFWSVESTVCQTRFNGECRDLFAGCPVGYIQTESHCGIFQACCYRPRNDTDSTSGTAGTSGSTVQHNGNGTCGRPLVHTDHRIVGGRVTIPGAYPWQASLMYHGSLVCGGTLINDQWILTAAHCFEDTPHTNWTVGLGLQSLTTTHGHMHRVSNIVVHSRYNGDTMLNDITLMKLAKPVDIKGKYIRPACLPARGETFHQMVCTATGWGDTTSDGEISLKLREVNLPIISNKLCRYYLKEDEVHDSNICAGDTGHDTCQGDSGGPLACPVDGIWKVAGVVSWGYGCAEKNSPGLYTRVESFLDWIDYIMLKHQ